MSKYFRFEQSSAVIFGKPEIYGQIGVANSEGVYYSKKFYSTRCNIKQIRKHFEFINDIAYYKKNVRVAYFVKKLRIFLRLIRLTCKEDLVIFLIPEDWHPLLAEDTRNDIIFMLAPVGESFLPKKKMTIEEFIAEVL